MDPEKSEEVLFESDLHFARLLNDVYPRGYPFAGGPLRTYRAEVATSQPSASAPPSTAPPAGPTLAPVTSMPPPPGAPASTSASPSAADPRRKTWHCEQIWDRPPAWYPRDAPLPVGNACDPPLVVFRFDGVTEAGLPGGWTEAEVNERRRLVRFAVRWNRGVAEVAVNPVRRPFPVTDIVISSIWDETQQRTVVTSHDALLLVERLLDGDFMAEEAGRLRRLLDKFESLIKSKHRQEDAEFYWRMMNYVRPKARRQEKDMRIFTWETLAPVLESIFCRYGAKCVFLLPRSVQALVAGPSTARPSPRPMPAADQRGPSAPRPGPSNVHPGPSRPPPGPSRASSGPSTAEQTHRRAQSGPSPAGRGPSTIDPRIQPLQTVPSVAPHPQPAPSAPLPHGPQPARPTLLPQTFVPPPARPAVAYVPVLPSHLQMGQTPTSTPASQARRPAADYDVLGPWADIAPHMPGGSGPMPPFPADVMRSVFPQYPPPPSRTGGDGRDRGMAGGGRDERQDPTRGSTAGR